ncbi:hypothetical protein JKF63_00983 [Porcisia hertigi]|uniref:Calphotin-like protein n=1 Tax=Porcisia hertigi TaxID=2761500 RepID=A0A836HCN7_9TRYP|nr:hypothetical protein JKF63_00983 [Porcisia hertigi]
MLLGDSAASLPTPLALQVPVPTQPAPLLAAPLFPVLPARGAPTAIPVPLAASSPAVAPVSLASPCAPMAFPVAVESPSVLMPAHSSFEPTLVRNAPCIPSTTAAQYAAPLSASLSGGASASSSPVARVSLSTSHLSAQAALAPPVPLLPVSPATVFGKPQLPVPQSTQSALPLPASNVAPYLTPSPGSSVAASPPPSILMASVPAPVGLVHPDDTRKVTFVPPGGGAEGVAASSLPAVPVFVPSAPARLPETSVPLSSSSPALPPPDVPQLRASEEPANAVVPVDVVSSEEEQAAYPHVPDYTTWIYPVLLKGSSLCSPPLKFPLADASEPHLLSPIAPLRWSEEEVASALPATLPPEYVVFGGAKYSGAPLDLVRPPLAVTANVRRAEGSHKALEGQRLQFLVDQLELARQYLKIETRRVVLAQRVASSPATTSHVAARKDVVSGTAQMAGEAEDVAKANIWTTAYFGSPEQLSAAMEKRKFDGMLDSTGYVHYRRRQWGLKRAGDTFVLGLGMRGTLLQFAAAAGKLDSVVLLLTIGAQDRATPRLKDILSAESMQLVQAVCQPRDHARRPNCASRLGAAAPRKEVLPVRGPSFTSEHVMTIDGEGQSPLRGVGGFAAAAMGTFA